MASEQKNIVLPYAVAIYVDRSMDTVLFGDAGASFFVDEHGHQWVKFIARNGPRPGQEHMLRTEQVVITRNDGESSLEGLSW